MARSMSPFRARKESRLGMQARAPGEGAVGQPAAGGHALEAEILVLVRWIRWISASPKLGGFSFLRFQSQNDGFRGLHLERSNQKKAGIFLAF